MANRIGSHQYRFSLAMKYGVRDLTLVLWFLFPDRNGLKFDRPQVYARYRRTWRGSRLLIVEGDVQQEGNVTNQIAGPAG